MKIRKIFFMLTKFRSDLKTPKLRYAIAEDVHSSDLTWYYFLFKEERVSAGKDQALISKFDENGIPVNKTYIDVTDKEYVYFPISIGQMGLAVFHTYLQTQSEKDKQRFLKFADWFCDNVETSVEFGARWLTDVALPQYKNPGPWASAFSQARAMNILLRAYQLTGKPSYAELAEKALVPFTKSAQAGGVTSFTEWGPFYEEYTAEVPTLVLNGNVFALLGLYDFIRVFPENTLARKLYNDGVNTLINILPEYDLGFWSRYNYCRADWHPGIDPATISYQRLHQVQMRLLHQLTGNQIFHDYAVLFRQQDTVYNALRMYVLKYQSLKKIGRL
ncbi:MAG: D-glucuronyl C5-epimerase family protein [Fidelibacterota bacterium]